MNDSVELLESTIGHVMILIRQKWVTLYCEYNQNCSLNHFKQRCFLSAVSVPV